MKFSSFLVTLKPMFSGYWKGTEFERGLVLVLPVGDIP